MKTKLKVMNSWDDVPAFASDSEETAFWDTHALGPDMKLTGHGPLDAVLATLGDREALTRERVRRALAQATTKPERRSRPRKVT
jgi:hypothetical protein